MRYNCNNSDDRISAEYCDMPCEIAGGAGLLFLSRTEQVTALYGCAVRIRGHRMIIALHPYRCYYRHRICYSTSGVINNMHCSTTADNPDISAASQPVCCSSLADENLSVPRSGNDMFFSHCIPRHYLWASDSRCSTIDTTILMFIKQ